MQLRHAHEMSFDPAPEEPFTGDVQIGGYDRRRAPSNLVSATVVFAPGARTPWKSNPLGQTVAVLSGSGRAQAGGQDPVGLRAGDVVWFPPGEVHWEGAGPDGPMTCLALQEEGRESVRFLSAVTDEQYDAADPVRTPGAAPSEAATA